MVEPKAAGIQGFYPLPAASRRPLSCAPIRVFRVLTGPQLAGRNSYGNDPASRPG
jgi:hypothetical protein